MSAPARLSVELLPELVEAIAQRAAVIAVAQLEAADGGDRWLTSEQAGAYIGASARRIRDLVEAGALLHSRDGRKLLIRRSALDAYVNGQRP
jgi:excisionase family DNA binding protein